VTQNALSRERGGAVTAIAVVSSIVTCLGHADDPAMRRKQISKVRLCPDFRAFVR
jgi:hypothetical protein